MMQPGLSTISVDKTGCSEPKSRYGAGSIGVIKFWACRVAASHEYGMTGIPSDNRGSVSLSENETTALVNRFAGVAQILA
jgi:hypothetical protein